MTRSVGFVRLGVMAAGLVIVVVAAACDFQGTWTATTPLPAPPGAPAADFHQVVSCTSSGACVRAGATADVWNGSTWSSRPAPPTPLTDLSCVSASDCLGFTSAGPNNSSGQSAYHFNGTTWADIGWPAGNDPTSVSCASSTVCMVVGLVVSDQSAMAERWNGSSLSATALPADSPELDAVSCPSTTFCLAVGRDGGNGAGARWTGGTTWSTVATTNLSGSPLQFVSCVAATACTATTGGDTFQVTTWNGTTLSGGPQRDPMDFEDGYFQVACGAGSVEQCFAISFDTSVSAVSLSAIGPASGPELTVTGGSSIADVSCTSATNCMAVGADADGVKVSWHFNGTAWSEVGFGPAPPDPLVGSESCPSSSFCMAVGSTMHGKSRAAYATTWNGTSWSIPSPSLPALSANSLVSSSVSCTSNTFCMLALDETDNTGEFPSADLDIYRWNGTSWVLFIASFATQPASISCTSPTFCLVVTATDQWTWNGASFAHASESAGFGPGTPHVSCVSPTRCAVAMEYGPPITDSATEPALAMWNGTTYTDAVPAPVPAGQDATITGLSCAGPTTTLCVVVGGVGPPGTSSPAPYVAQGDGSDVWTVASLPVTGPGWLEDVSCANTAECVALGTGTSNGTTDPRLAVAFSINTWFRAPDLPADPTGSVGYDHLACVGFHCEALGHVGPTGAATVLAAGYTWTDSS